MLAKVSPTLELRPQAIATLITSLHTNKNTTKIN